MDQESRELVMVQLSEPEITSDSLVSFLRSLRRDPLWGLSLAVGARRWQTKALWCLCCF